MTRYVLGFAFTPNLMNVALIEKVRTRPGFEFMRGKLNGLGGLALHVEGILDAMEREFQEESGVHIPAEDWSFCGTFLKRREYEVHVFRAVSESTYHVRTNAPEEGNVSLYPVDGLCEHPTTDALRWLMPLVLYPDLRVFRVVER